MDVNSRFMTIEVLVVLEGLVERGQRCRPGGDDPRPAEARPEEGLRYGLVGAFAFRTAASLLATYFIQMGWVKNPRSGCYLLSDGPALPAGGRRLRNAADQAGANLARVTALWATVVKVELVNIAFSVS